LAKKQGITCLQFNMEWVAVAKVWACPGRRAKTYSLR